MGLFDLPAEKIKRIEETLAKTPDLNKLLPNGNPSQSSSQRASSSQASAPNNSRGHHDGGETDRWSGPASNYSSDRGSNDYSMSARESGGNYGTASDNSGAEGLGSSER